MREFLFKARAGGNVPLIAQKMVDRLHSEKHLK
jgi:hypothetical protein